MVNGPVPSILLLGVTNSGKTSIQKVVLEHVQPLDTVALPPTTTLEALPVFTHQSVRFEVWDCPGQTNALMSPDAHTLLESCAAIVFVLDATGSLDEPLQRLVQTVRLRDDTGQGANVPIEVFIHKVEKMSAGEREAVQKQVMDYVNKPGSKGLRRESFHFTSIYDCSIFSAFSVAVQRVVKKKQAYMVSLLEFLTSSCQLRMSYLFLSKTKLYVAEGKANEEESRMFFQVCSEAMDMQTQLDGMYRNVAVRKPAAGGLSDHHRRGRLNHAATEEDEEEKKARRLVELYRSEADGMGDAIGGPELPRELCSSILHLGDQNVLYLREIPNDFTIVMIMSDAQLENRALVDFNVSVFSSSVAEICNARDKS